MRTEGPALEPGANFWSAHHDAVMDQMARRLRVQAASFPFQEAQICQICQMCQTTESTYY